MKKTIALIAFLLVTSQAMASTKGGGDASGSRTITGGGDASGSRTIQGGGDSSGS